MSDDCNGCGGHGYYWISADAAGTEQDVKKTCRDCGGTGKQGGIMVDRLTYGPEGVPTSSGERLRADHG